MNDNLQHFGYSVSLLEQDTLINNKLMSLRRLVYWACVCLGQTFLQQQIIKWNWFGILGLKVASKSKSLSLSFFSYNTTIICNQANRYIPYLHVTIRQQEQHAAMRKNKDRIDNHVNFGKTPSFQRGSHLFLARSFI